jgi:hypothetical protein
VMLLLLSISIGMAGAISHCNLNDPAAACSSAGSFGDMIGSPDKGINVQMLLNYILVLGLLFATFKISSALATSIAGMRFGVAPQLMLGGLAGAIGGRGLGWAAFRGKKIFDGRMKKAQDAGDDKGAARSAIWSKRFDALSKKTFSPTNTAPVKGVAKSFGLSGAGAGQFGTQAYAKSVADRGHAIADKLKGARMSDDKAKEIVNKDRTAAVENERKEELRQQKEARQQTVEAARSQAAAVKEGVRAQRQQSREQSQQAQTQIQQQLEQVQQELQAAGEALQRNPADVGAAARVTAAQQRSAILMSERSAIIEQAKSRAQELEQTVTDATQAIREAQDAHRDADKALSEHEQDVAKARATRAKELRDSFNVGIGKYVGIKTWTVNPDVIAAARHDLGEADKKANENKWKQMFSPDKPPPAPPAAGAAPAGGDHGGGGDHH